MIRSLESGISLDYHLRSTRRDSLWMQFKNAFGNVLYPIFDSYQQGQTTKTELDQGIADFNTALGSHLTLADIRSFAVQKQAIILTRSGREMDTEIAKLTKRWSKEMVKGIKKRKNN